MAFRETFSMQHSMYFILVHSISCSRVNSCSGGGSTFTLSSTLLKKAIFLIKREKCRFEWTYLQLVKHKGRWELFVHAILEQLIMNSVQKNPKSSELLKGIHTGIYDRLALIMCYILEMDFNFILLPSKVKFDTSS